MSIYIKNISGSTKTIRGHVLADQEYLLIPETERSDWHQDSSVFDFISLNEALLSKTDDGSTDITDHTEQWNYLGNNLKSEVVVVGNSPFASKILPTGEKLFRRKHGIKETINASSSKSVVFTCPYGVARINKLEIIDANALDRVDLIVKSPADPAIAALYGLPANYNLNQFGFDVVVGELLYSDKSDYDAEVYQGFQIVIVYKNDSLSNKEVGFNLIYHEVVS